MIDVDIVVFCLGKMFVLLIKDEFFNLFWEFEVVDVMKLISYGLWKEI